MKVWTKRLRELEVEPVNGMPRHVRHGCQNCSSILILGRDVYRTEGNAILARKRELTKRLVEQRRVVDGLEAELLLLEDKEKALKAKREREC